MTLWPHDRCLCTSVHPLHPRIEPICINSNKESRYYMFFIEPLVSYTSLLNMTVVSSSSKVTICRNDTQGRGRYFPHYRHVKTLLWPLKCCLSRGVNGQSVKLTACC